MTKHSQVRAVNDNSSLEGESLREAFGAVSGLLSTVRLLGLQCTTALNWEIFTGEAGEWLELADGQ